MMAFGYHQNIGLKGLGASYSKDSFHSYGFNLAPILLLRKRRSTEGKGGKKGQREGRRKEGKKEEEKERREGGSKRGNEEKQSCLRQQW